VWKRAGKGECNSNDKSNCKGKGQRQRLLGWVMVVIPPIAKCAMDGAPVDCRLVEENRQQQVHRRVGRERVVAEKRISPLRRSQSARAASVEMTMQGNDDPAMTILQ
jgi:hypothetical protein